MKRLDYYALMATLLAGGAVCLYFGQDIYAGMFLGVFFTFIKDLLGIETVETINNVDVDAEIGKLFPKD